MIRADELRQALSASRPGEPDRCYAALSAALRAGLHEEVRDFILVTWPRPPREPRIEQVLGLACRGLLDSAEAQGAFARAAAARPNDPLLAHSEARAALEAGAPAAGLFERAQRLAPEDLAVHQGHFAALLAEGHGAQAFDELENALLRFPDWADGYVAYARAAGMHLPETDPAAPLRAALARRPGDQALWQTLFRILTGAGNYRALLEAVGEARTALGASVALDWLEALALGELDEVEAASARFATLPLPATGDDAVWPVRTLIRAGRIEPAARLAEMAYPVPGEAAIWPYRALLWRLLGDQRWQWLEGDERLIRAYDLSAALGPLEPLAATLRRLHLSVAQPLEQSLRGGTQTDGNLFARAEPEIRALREAIAEAVRAYVAQLPPHDAHHPTLREPRAPLRFAGAWSVRLAGGGFHVDHVHTHGWLSSACYIALPDTARDEPEAGWLSFGENRELLPDLRAFRSIEPEPGKLVLFPSTMWHGTHRFGAGERLTVAFDIARPGA